MTLLHGDKPTEWMVRAACAGSDPEMWFPERGDARSRNAAYVRAKQVCARCPVTADCLAFALTEPVERIGVWGGTSARERGRLLGGRAR